MCRSSNPIASHQNYCKMILNCVLPYVQLHPIEFILREFKIAAKPKFDCAITSLFPDISKSCRSRISIAIYRNYSETIPNCVLAKTGLHHTEKKFCDSSKTCPRRISKFQLDPTEKIRRLSKCAEVEKQLILIKLILRHFQRVS